jgi:putative ATP-binding cassette transporter
MRGIIALLADVWRLSRPYFATSEQRWSARLLLGTIIALDLSRVGMTVLLSFWNRAFYNALEQKDWSSFIALLGIGQFDDGLFMPGFGIVAFVYIVVAIYRTYLSQWLEINWRRWLTERMIDDWLAHRAYFRLSLMPGAGTGDAAANGGNTDAMAMSADNPDQRISEDARDFVQSTLALSLGLLSSVVSLFSFVTILWSLSGPLVVLGLPIPGYLVWVAIIYAIIGTWLTHKVGKPLAMLDFLQQKLEANFRFSLVRLRENVEGIALYRGEAAEASALKQRFTALADNWWDIMWRTKKVIALTAGYNQAASVFPVVVVSPRFFSGEISLGQLTQTAGAFGRVEDSLSFFVNAYRSFATWRATVGRLAGFRRAIETAHQAALAGDGVAVTQGSGPAWELNNVQVRLPTGRTLIDEPELTLEPGRSVVVTGRSGTGKSTLFRALAGIWPFGSGTVARPPGRHMFLPQRPYLPLGSLRTVVAYPDDPATYGDARLREVLEAVGLGHLADHLDEEAAWAQRLSGGEQQRLAVARAVLGAPDWLFLDEATASLDPESEAQVYALLRRVLPGTTIVSIAHRPAVADMHDRRLVLDEGTTGGRLREAEVTPG